VVLVGEIRDRETAGIAIQASLTGHLVLSTLHTNDAAGAIARLLDIGIEGYKLGAAVKGVVAQRLVRRLCVHCRETTKEVSGRVRRYIPEETTIYKAVGCAECGDTGYRGRLCLTEVLLVSNTMERAIASGDTTDKLHDIAREEGMTTLWDSGIAQILAGITDVEELLRVVEPPLIDVRHAEDPQASKPKGRSSSRSRKTTGVNVVIPPLPLPTPAPAAPDFSFELLDDALSDLQTTARKRVLVASSDPQVSELLSSAVDASAVEVIGVADGVDALDSVDGARPDVVVLDCELARLDGLAVLARMRSRSQFSRIPVIVLSLDDDEETEIEAFAKGANDFVARPLRTRALAARIRKLLSSS
jgi:CheY-like chemotaxis protein